MNRDHDIATPLCPHCGGPMIYVRSVPKLGALPELRSYRCKACGEVVTEAVEPRLPPADDPQTAYYPP